MPIYEYCCKDCQQVFEEWTKRMDDPEPRRCPLCGGESSRIVSHSSFQLKGGGWYVSDYGYRKGKEEGEKKSEPAAAKNDAAPKADTPAVTPAPAAAPAASAAPASGAD